MIFDVEVTEAENGIDVHIVNTGIDRAPLRVELAFDAGCRVETEHFAADGAEGGGIVAKSGTLTAPGKVWPSRRARASARTASQRVSLEA